MAVSKDNQVKEGKKTAEKKVTEKKISKTPKANPKRYQPTAAARLISSPYIKFGWHQPLSGQIKETVQELRTKADSMYMLQISRDRPIESLSLRNGLFWERRKLHDPSIVSTPALDHIDLFPACDVAFQDTLQKIGKQKSDNGDIGLHYLFEPLRSREFLVLPIQIDGAWVTIITKMRPKVHLGTDLEVTDLAIVDPVPNGPRKELISRRLVSILTEGCIRLSSMATVRNIKVPSLTPCRSHLSGLVAYAVSREFLRRLKVLQYRRSYAGGPIEDENFLWADFEEGYNFGAYRQDLMSACAHQTIEASDYQVRMALEVPSSDANYQPSLLRPQNEGEAYRDEKWEIFQSPTHTLTFEMSTSPNTQSQKASSPSAQVENQCATSSLCATSSGPSFTSPSYTSEPEFICKTSPRRNSLACSPTSLAPPAPPSPNYSPNYSPTSPGQSPNSPNSLNHSPISPSYSPTSPRYSPTSPKPTTPVCRPSTPMYQPAGSHYQAAPIASMGSPKISTRMPWNFLSSPKSLESLDDTQSESQPQETSRKRSVENEDEDDVEAPPAKRQKTEDA
ncbi:hypothetical protein F4679DRAFT_126011 [Xylaria curta]|nr:hypothetical protein F4679DRAFT_126011 [Xylaria curta]